MALLKPNPPKKDNPKLGVAFYLMSGFFLSLNYILGKTIYVHKPLTTPFQILAYRSIISTVMMIIKVNRNLKYVVWDSIERG